jgi:uncharacterized cupredoxin-like copper-binding protein
VHQAGELHQAAQLYQQVLTEAERTPMHRTRALSRIGAAQRGLGALALEWNDLETAEQLATHAVTIGRHVADEELRVRSSLILARVKHVRGETTEAQQLLQTLVAQAPRMAARRRCKVVATDFTFAFDAAQVRTGTITFLAKNEGFIPHDFAVQGNGVDQKTTRIKPGQTTSLTLDLKSGTYAYKCTVPGHALFGMKGILTVPAAREHAAPQHLRNIRRSSLSR